jgi:hypothetical protein
MLTGVAVDVPVLVAAAVLVTVDGGVAVFVAAATVLVAV